MNKVNIKKCVQCGCDHFNTPVYKFSNEQQKETGFAAYAICPTKALPIYINYTKNS